MFEGVVNQSNVSNVKYYPLGTNMVVVLVAGHLALPLDFSGVFSSNRAMSSKVVGLRGWNQTHIETIITIHGGPKRNATQATSYFTLRGKFGPWCYRRISSPVPPVVLSMESTASKPTALMMHGALP